jgi:hypothetical protein
MIKRDITETVYEYDKEGKLLKKTVTETHEEEDNTVTTYPSWSYLNGTQPYRGDITPCTLTDPVKYSDNRSNCAVSALDGVTNDRITG